MTSEAILSGPMKQLGWLLLAVLPGCVAGSLNERAFYPQAEFRLVPEDLNLEAEAFVVPVEGALLHAWRFRAPESGGDVLVVCGGNSDNKELFLPLARGVVDAGLDVVLFDARGFGLSTGEPDLWSLVPDGAAVLQRVCADPATRHVAVFGVSLGSPVALAVADRMAERIDAVVVESLLVPRHALAQEIGGFAAFLTGWAVIPAGFDVADHARELEQPVLFVHGAEDELTELEPAAQVFAAARTARAPRAIWIAADAGHAPGIAGLYGGEYLAQLMRFLEAALRGAPDHARVEVDWNAPQESAVVELGPDAVAHTPVEITLVRELAGPLSARVFADPGHATAVPFPGAGAVIGAFGNVPAGEVAKRADGGWERAAPELEAERACLALEEWAYERLGYGKLLRVGDVRVFYRFGEEPAPEQLAAACAEARARLEETEEGGLPPDVQMARAELWRALARRCVELGDESGAGAAIERALALFPADPFAAVRYGDASWQLGVRMDDLAADVEAVAGLIRDADRRAELQRMAEGWREVQQERDLWLEDWLARQRAERDRLATAAGASVSEAEGRPQ
ncbi:MAG: alpha/beta fold hydrolase [Planctomycetota bacterium]|nr:MAG: alpha/beta fold hydrolase [Planctomycetota bacterium]